MVNPFGPANSAGYSAPNKAAANTINRGVKSGAAKYEPSQQGGQFIVHPAQVRVTQNTASGGHVYRPYDGTPDNTRPVRASAQPKGTVFGAPNTPANRAKAAQMTKGMKSIN